MTFPRPSATLALLAALAACGTPPADRAADAPFAFEEATVADLQARMAAGTLTARQLAQAYLDRIAAVDPLLRSVIEVNPEALATADSLDRERAAGSVRGPLHGIPVLVKDNIATGDRMETTAGSLALVGARAPRDAFIVARLRAAGAVLLGKANLSEWANIRSTRSSSGWSGRGGQVRNPYALDRSPCGSSSGTGAAIAANLAAVGVGTETDGSIVCPSGANALVGLKPTVGLLSRSGIIPISHSQDTPGPMTRTVADAAALLSAMTGTDSTDPASAAAAGRAAADYTAFLRDDALRGVRVGILRGRFTGVSPAADAAIDSAIAVLRRAGAEVVDPVDLPHAGTYDADEFRVLLVELKAGLAAYLREWAPDAPVTSLRDVIAWNRAHADRELPFFGQEIFEMADTMPGLDDPAYLAARARSRRLAGPEGIDAALRTHRVDVLLAPTGSPAWTIDVVNGDHFTLASSTAPAVSGYPSVTVPALFVHGLPVGVSFIGPAWSDGPLLGYAYAYEQASRVRRPPRLPPSVDPR